MNSIEAQLAAAEAQLQTLQIKEQAAEQKYIGALADLDAAKATLKARQKDEQAALAERSVLEDDPSHVLRDLVEQWATDRETVFDVRVQLRTDAERMPVEDAGVDWPQDESPYRSVATVRLPPQQPYSSARRVFADDRLAFRPWHGLAAHRPLGSVNRLRQEAYEALGAQRFGLNAVEGTEMRSVDELPE